MMKFHKYQALGNDFVIVKDSEIDSEKARNICDRHFGVGADGILIHYKTDSADAGMKIINSDGSTAVMCGNGLRCFCAYLVYDCGFTKNPISVETGNGILSVSYKETPNGLSVDADLGKPTLLDGEFFEFSPVGRSCRGIGISMGNPHLVVLPEDSQDDKNARLIADEVQSQNRFGIELNVEVVTGIDRKNRMISMIVKERGAGYTLGCGTGGAAIIEALRIDGIIQNEDWSMTFPGGVANYRFENGAVVMSGIPKKVFSGDF
jgi:diaminopimelate epimerase